MKDSISVVSITLNHHSMLYPDFKKRSAIEKIDWLADSVKNAYKAIQAEDPNTMVIIAWPENAICDPDSEMINLEAKDYLHKKMQELIAQFPLLTIFAGTVTVKRPVNENKELLIEALKYYHSPELKKVDEHEKKFKNPIYHRLQKHIQDIEEILAYDQKISTAFIVSNTCYVYSHVKLESTQKEEKTLETEIKSDDESQYYLIFTKRKMAPYNEVEDNITFAFRPASSKTNNPFVILTHPISGKKFKVLIEICYEHNYLHLKETITTPEELLLQLIFSNSVKKRLTHLIAPHVIQSDALLAPSHVSFDPDPKNSGVKVYRWNGLQKDAVLEGPLKPFFPLESTLHNLFDQTLAELENMRNHLRSSIYASKTRQEKILKELIQQYPLFDSCSDWIKSTLEKQDESAYAHFLKRNIHELESQMAHLQITKNKFLNICNLGESVEAFRFLQGNIHLKSKTISEKIWGMFTENKSKYWKTPFINNLVETVNALISAHSQDKQSQLLNTKWKAPLDDRTLSETPSPTQKAR